VTWASPKRKDWTKGNYQIGLYFRSPEGGLVEAVSDKAAPDVVEAAKALLQAMSAPGKKGAKK